MTFCWDTEHFLMVRVLSRYFVESGFFAEKIEFR